MPRRMVYDIDVEVPAAVLYQDFTGIGYWQDLVAFYQEHANRTEIAKFASDDTGTDIAFSHILSAADLPAIARPVMPATFAVTREQHFEPFAHSSGQAAGHFRAAVPSAPVDIRGDYLLADTDRGSRMRLQSQCTVRVPLIGGQIEQLIITGLRALFAEEGRFTAAWVAAHH